jgi:hypothetical protein
MDERGGFRTSNRPEPPWSRFGRAFLLAAILIGMPGTINLAVASYDLAQNVHVSNADIAASLERNGYAQSFSQAAANLSSNVENGSGDLGLYNGSCCTGVLQMNQANLLQYCHCTPTQYAGMTLDEQTKYWGQLTIDGFKSTTLQKLNAMTTFDGQPVDDALKLACIQLGTGNCNKMISSGSCSGFADSNGTSICTMAAKIRNGPPGSPPIPAGTQSASNGTVNTIAGGDNTVGEGTDTKPMNGDGIPMGNPIYCWSCDIIVYTLSVAENAVSTGVTQLTGALMPTIGWLVGIGILYRLTIAMVAGIDPIRYTLPTIARAALVLCILSNGGAVLTDVAMTSVLEPTINGGAQVGQGLANNIAATFDVVLDNIQPVAGQATIPVTNDCSYNATAQVTIKYLIAAEAAATSLACTIHSVETTEVEIGIYIANSNKNASTIAQKIYALGVNVAGGLMSSLGMIGMLKFGMIFLDVVTSLAVAMAFLPWALYAWIFESTKRSFEGLCRRLIHAFLTLTLAGVAAVTAIFLALAGMKAGLGIASTALDPAQVLIAAQNLVVSMDMTNPTTTAQVAQFVFFTMGSCLAANHVLGHAQQISGSIVGIQISKVLSAAATSALSTATSSMGGTLGGFLGIVGSTGAKAAGAAATRFLGAR